VNKVYTAFLPLLETLGFQEHRNLSFRELKLAVILSEKNILYHISETSLSISLKYKLVCMFISKD
jgi:hypothetical protein